MTFRHLSWFFSWFDAIACENFLVKKNVNYEEGKNVYKDDCRMSVFIIFFINDGMIFFSLVFLLVKADLETL